MFGKRGEKKKRERETGETDGSGNPTRVIVTTQQGFMQCLQWNQSNEGAFTLEITKNYKTQAKSNIFQRIKSQTACNRIFTLILVSKVTEIVLRKLG